MKKLILIITIFILPNISLAYQWPVDNSLEQTFDKPQRITATLGEYRKGHLHAGVDINPVEGVIIGTQVYAVEGGEIPLIDERKMNESGKKINKPGMDDKINDKGEEESGSDFSYVRVVSKDGKRIFNYLHIEPDSDLSKSWNEAKRKKESGEKYEKIKITTGQLLGIIKKLDGLSSHLHFEENAFTLNDDGKSYTMSPGAHNPLASLTNHTDTASTQIYADSLEIKKNVGR